NTRLRLFPPILRLDEGDSLVLLGTGGVIGQKYGAAGKPKGRSADVFYYLDELLEGLRSRVAIGSNTVIDGKGRGQRAEGDTRVREVFDLFTGEGDPQPFCDEGK